MFDLSSLNGALMWAKNISGVKDMDGNPSKLPITIPKKFKGKRTKKMVRDYLRVSNKRIKESVLDHWVKSSNMTALQYNQFGRLEEVFGVKKSDIDYKFEKEFLTFSFGFEIPTEDSAETAKKFNDFITKVKKIEKQKIINDSVQDFDELPDTKKKGVYVYTEIRFTGLRPD